jgi:HEAT repeat protein
MITERDLAAGDKPASQLIDAIWAARQGGRMDLHPAVAALLEHEDPIVREEALSLLLVKWSLRQYRPKAAAMLLQDEDFGVRGRAAIGLAAVSDPSTRREDVAVLVRTLKDADEDMETRRASYEALLLMTNRDEFPSYSKAFVPERDVDWGLIETLRKTA